MKFYDSKHGQVVSKSPTELDLRSIIPFVIILINHCIKKSELL